MRRSFFDELVILSEQQFEMKVWCKVNPSLTDVSLKIFSLDEAGRVAFVIIHRRDLLSKGRIVQVKTFEDISSWDT
jgi:hypothetical protein